MNPFRRARADAPRADRSAELLGRAARGDEAAFAELYDELADLVYGVVLRVLRDPARSEEVAQEVFVEMWRLAPRYEVSKGSPRAWISTIAHRRAVDRVRSEESARARDSADARSRVIDVRDIADVVTDDLDRARVGPSLEDLSDKQREAVELAYYGGKTHREVASLLDVPEGTVKTRIRDGLIRLRDILEVNDDG